MNNIAKAIAFIGCLAFLAWGYHEHFNGLTMGLVGLAAFMLFLSLDD